MARDQHQEFVMIFSEGYLRLNYFNWPCVLNSNSVSLLVFRSKILCDAKPKPVSIKFQSKRSRLPQSAKGEGVIYYAKSEVLDLDSNLLFLGGGGGGM